jgi:hypothetical protein
MAIIQISKIQVRSGDLVDLPQLDDAEFGWASDTNRLFIGKTTPVENIEVLTSYSNIYFSQLIGSSGNLNISNAQPGQVLTYTDGNEWINSGGNALNPPAVAYYSNTPIHLGNVTDVYMGGGSTGYILQTDGYGNLSWTTNGTLYTDIINIVNGNANIGNATLQNVITMSVANTVPYTNGQPITISGVQGDNYTIVNGKSFFIGLDPNFSANSTTVGSGNVYLFTDADLLVTANGAGFTAVANTGVATAAVLGAGTSAAAAGGTNFSVQYNHGGIISGDANFFYNPVYQNLNVNGTVTADAFVGNFTANTANFVIQSNQPNITSVGVLSHLSVSGNLTTTTITTGSNATAGTITGNFTLTAGSTLQASYADLAEYYEADQEYEPGTVLEFGGDKEVTIAQDGTTRVAGVVSTNPAYVMNAQCEGIATPIALQGRVPVKVRGRISKGDMMVSAGDGYARPWNNPSLGMVIGKALENFEGHDGIIEIAIGRL